jgi:hypothetical protein
MRIVIMVECIIVNSGSNEKEWWGVCEWFRDGVRVTVTL